MGMLRIMPKDEMLKKDHPAQKTQSSHQDLQLNPVSWNGASFWCILKSFGHRKKNYSYLEYSWQWQKRAGNAHQGKQWIGEASNIQVNLSTQAWVFRGMFTGIVRNQMHYFLQPIRLFCSFGLWLKSLAAKTQAFEMRWDKGRQKFQNERGLKLLLSQDLTNLISRRVWQK